MHRALLGLFVVAACGLAFAGDEPNVEKPKSPAAVSAMTKHDIAVNRAQIEFRQAIAAADKQLVTDLDGAMAIALKAANVDEVKRIDAAKRQAQAATEEHASVDLKQVIIRQRYYLYDWGRDGQKVRGFELLPNGIIGKGSAAREARWSITRKQGHELLVITGDVGSCEMTPAENGVFDGKWSDAGAPVELRPAPNAG